MLLVLINLKQYKVACGWNLEKCLQKHKENSFLTLCINFFFFGYKKWEGRQVILSLINTWNLSKK